MILISASSYSQYPATKRIGKDSVVIITLKQGELMNQRFLGLSDSIKWLMSSMDSANRSFKYHQVQDINDVQIMYNRISAEKQKRIADSIALENFKSTIDRRYIHQDRVIKVVSIMFLIVSGLYFFSF